MASITKTDKILCLAIIDGAGLFVLGHRAPKSGLAERQGLLDLTSVNTPAKHSINNRESSLEGK